MVFSKYASKYYTKEVIQVQENMIPTTRLNELKLIKDNFAPRTFTDEEVDTLLHVARTMY